jgi:hypothetical protein
MMPLVALAAALSALASCTSQRLQDNAAGWREAECEKMLDTRQRERCLKEVRQYNEEHKKP